MTYREIEIIDCQRAAYEEIRMRGRTRDEEEPEDED